MEIWPETDCIFTQEWWWDAVCASQERLTLRLEGESPSGSGGSRMYEDRGLRGFWPLAKVKRMRFFEVLSQPPLTQHSGPWLSCRKDFPAFLEMLPPKALLKLNLGFALNDTERRLAEKSGMQVLEGATYVLEDTQDLEKVFAGLKSSQQRQIKKARKHLYRVEAGLEVLLDLQKETFTRRGLACPYPEPIMRKLYAGICRHGAGELVALADEAGEVMACGLFVYDKHRCYSLTHGFHKTGQNLGAGSLLQWEGIGIASKRALVFDFEGSNIESIARFNSSFGARKETYSRIERSSSCFRAAEKAGNIFKHYF